MIGNCQVQTLSAAASMMLDDADIRILDYSQHYAREEENRARFADEIADADLIFCQTALLSRTNERELRARYGSKVVTLANFYFRGLFPDSCYIGAFENRLASPMTVHSVAVLDAYRTGLPQAEAIRAFSVGNLHRLGLLDAWSASMAEMHRREADGSVDVPGKDFMEAACRAYPAFLTMNHPSMPMLTDYFRRVLAHCGVRPSYANVLATADPLAVHDTTPILDEVAEHLDLPYRTSQNWKINSLGYRFVAREEYVAACYAAYDRTDPTILRVHSPTDLVAALRADARFKHLVDEDDTHSASTKAPVMLQPKAPVAAQPGGGRQAAGQLEEATKYIHRVHSFLQIIDPKVERLAVSLPTLMDDVARLRQIDTKVEALSQHLPKLMRSVAELQGRRLLDGAARRGAALMRRRARVKLAAAVAASVALLALISVAAWWRGVLS